MTDIAMSTLTRASPTRALSLPSGSPRSSPPASPTSTRGPRSVSWSLPSPRNSVSMSLPPLALRYPSMDLEVQRNPIECPGSPEYIAWRNFHLSKAKLSGITEIAAVMAGFSVVATVELQINDDANPYLLTAFSVVTALLVATTMMAIMISTCILPHIQVVAKMHPDIDLSESPHEKLQWYIDISWVLANSVSIFLFTLDVVILCWVKFTYFSETASWCATLIMAPVLVILCVFGIVFYRNMIQHQSQVSERKYQELEQLKRQLECSEIQHV